MKAYIYGYGKKAKEYIDNDGFIQWLYKKYSIVFNGIIDKDISKTGTLVNINSSIVEVVDSIKERDALICISLDKYDEVKKQLIEGGCNKENIVILKNELLDYECALIGIKYFEGKTGIEIGGPSLLYNGVYEICDSCDCVNFSVENLWVSYESERFYFNGKEIGKVIIAEATNLNVIPDGKYDFLLSSNNLEHVANPMKALREFARVVKVGGFLSIVVPNKDYTFDHNRKYTTFSHIMDDWMNNIGEDDLTHLEEITEKHDYDMDPECGGKEKFLERAKCNIDNRCLHHHVFSLEVLEKMLVEVGIDTLEKGRYGTNYFIVGTKKY